MFWVGEGKGPTFYIYILTIKAHEPQGTEPPGVSFLPFPGRGTNANENKQVPAAPGRHPRHGENQRNAARGLCEQPDPKGQGMWEVVMVVFNVFKVIFQSTAPHHGLASGTLAIAQPWHWGWARNVVGAPFVLTLTPLFSL